MANKCIIIVLVSILIILMYLLNKKENINETDKFVPNEEQIQQCGFNKENLEKIKQNIATLQSEMNNNFSFNKLLDPKIESLIKENIDIITTYTPGQVNCLLNQSEKNKLCESLQLFQMLQSQHIDLNNVINKYVMSVLKLRKYLLKNMIYNLNKECTNVSDKKKLIETHITEFNKTITRMFQVFYIYPSERGDIFKYTLNML